MGQLDSPGALSAEKIPDTFWIGRCLGLRGGLDAVVRSGLLAVWHSQGCSFQDVKFQKSVPQSSWVRFLWNADKLYQTTWRHIPKQYFHVYRRAITPKITAFFFTTYSAGSFSGKRGRLYGLVTVGVDVRPWGRSGYPCQSWSLNSRLLVPFVDESAGEILSAAVYRKYWICFHYVWASQPDCSTLYEWHTQTSYHITALAFPACCFYCRIQGHLFTSKAPWERWVPDEHMMQGEATPSWCKLAAYDYGVHSLIVFFHNLVIIS